MFETFDFTVLDDVSFKEDAVREEIVAPVLRRLGYQPSGPIRVQRSKALVHPFVRIGMRKHPVNIIPDYTLWHGEKAILVLDAKRPTESVVRSHHAEQAYSYAIHPEVRSPHFALCNGRRLVVYAIDDFDPILDLASEEFDSKWSEIERVLLPDHLLNPVLRTLLPDFGLAIARMGVEPAEVLDIPGFRLESIARVSDELFSATSACVFEGVHYMASFDFPPDAVEPLVACLARPLKEQLVSALARSPYVAYLDFMLEVDVSVHLGPLTKGDHDSFVPLEVLAILDSRLNRDWLEDEPKVPQYVFRLKSAFEALRNED